METTKNFSVSVVVPAYNEAATLEGVILDLLAVPFLSEIIVINDGSIDATSSILNKYRGQIVAITNQRNKGKGHSVASGLELARGDLALLLDADVVRYTARDLRALVEPVIKNECDFTIETSGDDFFMFLTVSVATGALIYCR